jgi:hypothetical protein
MGVAAQRGVPADFLAGSRARLVVFESSRSSYLDLASG